MKFLTLRHIHTLANRRGFSVRLDDMLMHITHKHIERIQSSFDLSDPFRVDPPFARQFTLIRAYCWMRGYDLSDVDHATVLIRRGGSHRAFDQRYQHAQLFEYKNMPLLQHEVAVWCHGMETHPRLRQ